MSSIFDERYGGADYYYGTEPNDFLRESVTFIPKGGTVLCLAEGEGRNSVFLAGQGFQVTGVDSNPLGLAKLKALAESRSVSVVPVCADLAEYEPGIEAWDGIVSIFCHLPPPLRRVVNARSVAALKPGGVLILEAYRPEQAGRATGGPPDPALCVSREILQSDFASLQWRVCESKERSVVEGRGHTGMASVIQFIGEKRGAGAA